MNPDSTNPFLNPHVGDLDLNGSFLQQTQFVDQQPLIPQTVFSHDTIPNQPGGFASTPVGMQFAQPTTGSVSSNPYQLIFSIQTPATVTNKTIQPFSGFTQEDATKFLGEIESYLTLSSIKTDSNRAVAAFHLHLKGPAIIWFNNLTCKDTWLTVKAAFIEEHCNITNPSMIAESCCFR